MLASWYKLYDENGRLLDHGVRVTDVSAGSGASAAGVQRGDVIVKIDDTSIDDTHPLVNVLMAYQPGDTVTLSIVRNSKTLQIKARLGTRP
jgi:putative serine protease PepD